MPNGFNNYIELDQIVPSRSGLYAENLPGINIELIDALRKNGKSSEDTWSSLYTRACQNLVSDVSKNLQDKFFVDLKLVSRESSKFLDDLNSESGAGLKIKFTGSRYTRMHIISVAVWAAIDYSDAVINFYDTDADGELLLTKTQDLTAGRNTINVDTDFEVDELFISINAAIYTIQQTENKFYAGQRSSDYLASSVLCEFDVCGSGVGSVEQVSGGGINAKYVVYCSADKFITENINLFKYALWWKVGVELTEERRFTENLNQYTTMTAERAAELHEYFNKRYEIEVMNAIKSQNILEDVICFQCKDVSFVQTSLP